MKKLFKKQLKKGFTLVEVLITMTIIGIISTVALVSYKDYVATSNEVATKQEMSQIAQVYQMGIATGQVDFTGTVDYEKLCTSYKTITGSDLPFNNQELTYVSTNKLQLVRRGVTVQYDLSSNKLTVND